MMMLLRRISGLQPAQITSSPAPRLADGHVDVRVDAVPPCGVDAGRDEAGAAAPVAAPVSPFDLHRQIGPTPPGYTPGECRHPAHVVLDGLRYGVTPLSADAIPNHASLLLCHHINPDGR